MKVGQPSGTEDDLWISIAGAVAVLATVAAGIVFRLGPKWHYLTNGMTALVMLAVVWRLQRQRTRNTARTAQQIDELMEALRSANSKLSSDEISRIETQLRQLRDSLLQRAIFPGLRKPPCT